MRGQALPLLFIVLSRDREKGEFIRFNPTQNRNLNFPASYKSGDLSLTFLASPPLDVSAGATAMGLGSSAQALRSKSGKIENSNFCLSWVKTYSNLDFSRSLDNTRPLACKQSIEKNEVCIIRFLPTGTLVFIFLTFLLSTPGFEPATVCTRRYFDNRLTVLLIKA